MRLKAGDVLDVVAPLTFVGEPKRLILRTGPKQGDTVWCGYDAATCNSEKRFIAEHNGKFICASKSNNGVGVYSYMTTTDPYAIEYVLTPPEAIQALMNGKRVKGNGFADSVSYLVADAKRDGGIRLTCDECGLNMVGNIDLNQMYAIVEG